MQRHNSMIRILPLLLVVLLVSACSQLAVPALIRPNFETETLKLRPGSYRLDPDHSFLLFKVGHLDLATYVGRFNEFDASLEFEPDDIESSSLQGIVDMTSIDTSNPTVDELLRDPQWFSATRFPQASFQSNKVIVLDEVDGKPLLKIEGTLTLRGVTLPVELEATFNGGADNLLTRKYTLGFTASGSFNRTDFGVDQFLGLVGNEVTLELYAEFQRQ